MSSGKFRLILCDTENQEKYTSTTMVNEQQAPTSAANNQSMGTAIPTQIAVQVLVDLDGLSYDDYFKKVEEMIIDLREFWKLEQRVKALKVAIQLAKFLAETSQIKLYAKKYKMITDTLDEFGRLVYTRIQLKAEGLDNSCQQQQQGLAATSYRHEDLTLTFREQAKETCRNWFMKVASIREFVPRFYTELALLKTCDILLKPATTRGVATVNVEQFYTQSLRRLTKAAWGLGDPVVAIHARVYLCKVAEKLIGWNVVENDDNSVLFELILTNLEASAMSVSQLSTKTILRSKQVQGFDLITYFDLLSNALQSIINFVTLNNDIYTDDDHLVESAKTKLESMFNCLMDKLTKNNSGECTILARNVILHSNSHSLPADIVAGHAVQLLEALETTHLMWRQAAEYDRANCSSDIQDITQTIYTVMDSFALALDGSDAFESNRDVHLRSSILSSVDRILEDLFNYETSPLNMNMAVEASSSLSMVPSAWLQASANYFKCFKTWLSYANHYVEEARVNLLLTRFVARIKKNRQYVNHYPIIIELIKALIANKKAIGEFKQVLGLESFFQLLELLRKDDHKFEASKWILETMRANLKLNKQQSEPVTISDKAMINFLLRLCSLMNGSLSLLTADDDIGHLSQLVVYFLDKIRIENFKDHLEFYSRCRSSVCNLIAVLKYLAKQSLVLAIEFKKVERKRNLRRNFLNGCLAFTFVTIPAINDQLVRLNLYIEGSRLAMDQMSLSLADFYLKQALLNLQFEPKEQICNSLLLSHSNDQLRAKVSTVHSKLLLDQVNCLLNVMLDFEDHIDFKHKLVLKNLIKNSFSEHPNLVESVKRLNVIDDDEYDNKNSNTNNGANNDCSDT